MRQFRKIKAASQKRRQMFILLAIMGALLVAISAIKAAMPTEAAKSATTVSTVQQEERQDIQAFADVVTKPLDTLTPEDLDLLENKAKDPCYAKYAMLLKAPMIEAILACKALK